MSNNKEDKIKNRSELMFFYDVIMANPNGDPLDENRPRIDVGTRKCLVSDVRLKRTIRDYLISIGFSGGEESKGDIFVREIIKDDGNTRTGHERAEMFKEEEYRKLKDKILNKCIDLRLFGCVIPLGKKKNKKKKEGMGKEETSENTPSNIQLTGPVQFRIGESIHEVDDFHIKGTGAFASSKGKEKKTFREEYILPYAFIGFEGIINEKNAGKTTLIQKDVIYLLEGIWEGTKDLITRSKFKHTPRMLLKINYKDKKYIGELKDSFKLATDMDEEKKIRGLKDFKLDATEFLKEVDSDRIETIDYLLDEKLKFVNEEAEINLIEKLKEILGNEKINRIEYNSD